MAARGPGGEGREARGPSDFIRALVKDPSNPPEVTGITGYIGAASQAGRTRIYLDTTLQNYVEVEEGMVLHVEPVAEGQLGLSQIFVAADAQIFPAEQAPKLDARTAFGGAVYQDYLSASGGAGLGGETPTRPITIGVVCPGTLNYNCPTHPAWCPPHTLPQICHHVTYQLYCPTRQVYCQHTLPQVCHHVTHQLYCPTRQVYCQHTLPQVCHHVTHQLYCPTRQVYCQHTLPQVCHWLPTRQVYCQQTLIDPHCIPVQSRQVCPSFGPCPTIQCGGWEGGLGPDPVGPQLGGMVGGNAPAAGMYDPYAAYSTGF